jgi:dihydrofolate reductase
VTESDPARLLERIRAANRGGFVHVVGGPRTIATFCGLAAVARLKLVILPLFLGDGMRLTPPRALDTALTLESERPLPGGSVELVYAVGR